MGKINLTPEQEQHIKELQEKYAGHWFTDRKSNDKYVRAYHLIHTYPEGILGHAHIKNKQQQWVEFELNAAQKMVLNKWQEQMQKNKRVRLVIVKARQQGISTLCRAIIMWKMRGWWRRHYLMVAQTQKDCIMHMQLLKQLFRSCPLIPPSWAIDKNDNTATGFTTIDDPKIPMRNSSIEGAWSNAGTIARGKTFNGVYMTEFEFFENAQYVLGDIYPAVPDCDDSFILIEGTARGHGNLYNLYLQSKEKKNNYEFLFLPWYITKEYAIESDEPLHLTDEQKEMQKRFSLSDAQMRWYAKTENNIGGRLLMRNEYPTVIDDCFAIDTSGNYFFDYALIEKAIQSPTLSTSEDDVLTLGIDIARKQDRIAMCWRKGPNVLKLHAFHPPQCNDNESLDNAILEQVCREIRAFPPRVIAIDATGLGGYFGKLLRERGFNRVVEVNFGEGADDHTYANKRTELYARARDWLSRGASIQEKGVFRNDWAEELKWIQFLPHKEKLALAPKKELEHSPDLADAFVITFDRRCVPWQVIPSPYPYDPMNPLASWGMGGERARDDYFEAQKKYHDDYGSDYFKAQSDYQDGRVYYE